MRFDAVSTPERLDDGAFRWVVPDGWQQGRGCFGGLVVAALCRSAVAAEDDAERAPRAMNAELCGPVMPGEARIVVETLRRGNAVSTMTVVLTQEDGVKARASFVLGGPRKDPTPFAGPAFEAPAWESVPPIPWSPAFPRFARNFEFRLVGPPPFASGKVAEAGGWLRAQERSPAMGHAEVAAYADVWWPAGFSVESRPRPAATVAFHLQWLVDPASLDPEAPLFCRARVVAADDGYVAETREIFAPDGRIAALNQQTFVWI